MEAYKRLWKRIKGFESVWKRIETYGSVPNRMKAYENSNTQFLTDLRIWLFKL